MIINTSRYANGTVGQVVDGHAEMPTTYVYRNFKSTSSRQSYFLYQFSEADRIDLLAINFIGSPQSWHKIMDINPEIADPFNIPVGTVLRIPNAG